MTRLPTHADPASLVCFSAYGAHAGSTRVRVFDWLRYAGINARTYTHMGAAYADLRGMLREPKRVFEVEHQLRNLENLAGATVLVQREVSPLSGGGLEQRILRAGALGVYDFDDALYVDWGRGHFLRRLRPKARKLLRALSAADYVIAGSEVLADWVALAGVPVTVIPSCVHPPAYQQKASYGLRSPPVIGWLGSPSQEAELGRIAPALRVAHKETGVTVEVISRGLAPLPGMNHFSRRVQWSEKVALDTIATWDTALMPLKDNPWQRGKCAYKLLQYGAARVPVIASAVGANRSILAGAALTAPKTLEEWSRAIVQMLRSGADERSGMAAALSTVVKQGYTFDVWRAEWLSAIGRLTQDR